MGHTQAAKPLLALLLLQAILGQVAAKVELAGDVKHAADDSAVGMQVAQQMSLHGALRGMQEWQPPSLYMPADGAAVGHRMLVGQDSVSSFLDMSIIGPFTVSSHKL